MCNYISNIYITISISSYTALTCPDGEDMVPLGSTDGTPGAPMGDLFNVTGEGPLGADPNDPLADPVVDPADAVAGTGESITITSADILILKENCPYASSMTLLSLMLYVKGATRVNFLVLGDGSMVIADDGVREAIYTNVQ